jgi:hypothetical protein
MKTKTQINRIKVLLFVIGVDVALWIWALN